MKNELKRYICIPFAIKIFNDDRENFREFKTANIYLDKLDAVLNQLEKDFYRLKGTYHSVRKISEGKYRFKSEVYEYDPGELRQETEKIMEEYLFSVEAEIDEERTWEP